MAGTLGWGLCAGKWQADKGKEACVGGEDGRPASGKGRSGSSGMLVAGWVLSEDFFEANRSSSGIDLLLALEDFFCFLFLPLDLLPGSLTDALLAFRTGTAMTHLQCCVLWRT